MNGVQMMIANMLKNTLENLPPEIKGNIDKIASTVLAFKQQLDRMERKQDLIISALNLSPEILEPLEKPKGADNERHDETSGTHGSTRTIQN